MIGKKSIGDRGYSAVLFREVELCSTLLIGLHISHPLLRRQSDTNIGFQNQGTSYFFSSLDSEWTRKKESHPCKAKLEIDRRDEQF